jgi:hypothetical protein
VAAERLGIFATDLSVPASCTETKPTLSKTVLTESKFAKLPNRKVRIGYL